MKIMDQLVRGGALQKAGREPFRMAVQWGAIMALAAFFYAALLPQAVEIAFALLRRQDRWLLLAEAGILLGSVLLARQKVQKLKGNFAVFLGAFMAMALACFAGHGWLLSGYDLSRDEQMASFDAAVFSSGHFFQPLPLLWRDHADALNTLFMYPAEHRAGWISTYLPMNAALRAVASLLGDPALAGPVMVLAGALALWACARRIWPEDRETAAVASLLYLGSGQVLFAGMTSYAMPAHLALNLIWLWLYLNRRWWSDAMAVAIGFVAMGLHQPIVHPMFAGPLLYLTLRERNWQRAGFFALGYALAGAFWLWWPSWVWHLVQASPAAPRPDGVDFLSRLIMVLSESDYAKALPLMTLNLLRFFAWQHVLLLPLLVLGLNAMRSDPLARSLAAGLFLTASVMIIILPDQGHGFGYRYFHGLIGNAILIAAYGWKRLTEAQAVWRGILLMATTLGLLIILPMQSWMAYHQYAPYARLDARIGASSAQYVVIGTFDAPYAKDLVYNSPKLDRRPIRLLRELVNPALAAKICASHARVALIRPEAFRDIAAFFTSSPHPGADHENAALAARLDHAGCKVADLL